MLALIWLRLIAGPFLAVFIGGQASGALAQINRRKRVFREPRKASEVDAVLKGYSDCIDAGGGGAILGSLQP